MGWRGVRVGTRAHTAHRGPRGGHEREPRVGPSDQEAACRGSVLDALRLRPACLARALQRWTSRIHVHFLLALQEVMLLRTPCNQGIILERVDHGRRTYSTACLWRK